VRVWLSQFTGAVIASAAASAASLVAGILALRLLPPDDAGRFTLLISVAGMLAVIALFGQANLINRVYAGQARAYHWPLDLRNSLSLSAALALLGLAVVAALFPFSTFELAFLAGFAILTVLVQVTAAMLNSYRRYVWASVLLRLSNALLVVPLGAAFFGLLPLALNDLLLFQLLIVLLCALLGLITVQRALPAPAGLPPIPLLERRETIGLAILTFSHLVLDPGLLVIAGYRLVPADLAGFGAYFTLFGPFLLVWAILLQTVGVEYGRNPAFPTRRVLLVVWVSLLPVVALSTALLPLLASFLYKGKYDAFSGIALPVSLMGGLLMAEAAPRGIIAVLAPARLLRIYTAVQAVLAMAMAALALWMVGGLAVPGIAWAGVIMLLGRNLVAYAFFAGVSAPREQSSVASVQ
jgi:hypothetical protein